MLYSISLRKQYPQNVEAPHKAERATLQRGVSEKETVRSKVADTLHKMWITYTKCLQPLAYRLRIYYILEMRTNSIIRNKKNMKKKHNNKQQFTNRVITNNLNDKQPVKKFKEITILTLYPGVGENGKAVVDMNIVQSNSSHIMRLGLTPNFIQEEDRVLTVLTGDIIKDIEDNNCNIVLGPTLDIDNIDDFVTPEVCEIYERIFMYASYTKTLFTYVKRTI